MKPASKLKRIFSGLGIVLLTLVLGCLIIRPVHLRWGATENELARPMPGDLDGSRWTRAITIAATPEQIWPWLVQWSQGRASSSTDQGAARQRKNRSSLRHIAQ